MAAARNQSIISAASLRWFVIRHGQAHDVIEFLDILRDQLWEAYCDQIIAMRLETEEQHIEQEDEIRLTFGEEEPF